MQDPHDCCRDSVVVHRVVRICRGIYSRSLYLYLGQCRLIKIVINLQIYILIGNLQKYSSHNFPQTFIA